MAITVRTRRLLYAGLGALLVVVLFVLALAWVVGMPALATPTPLESEVVR